MHISALHRLADRTLEVLLGQVRVTHRHLQCTVTQQLGYQPQVQTLPDHVARTGVAQVVPTEILDLCLFQR